MRIALCGLRVQQTTEILLLFCSCLPAAPAVLEGVALDYGSARPLARAHVSLQSLRGAVPLKTLLTDSSGHFSITDLPGEAYLLVARRPGYLDARYGQRKWNGAGTPIVLEAASHFFAELRLHRLGAITGEVLDENQVGLPNAPVAAYRAEVQPIRLAASATSDDRGVFRIPGLEPGQYYVRTGAFELEDRRGLLPTYFGQTTRAADARLVEVQLDAESRGARIEPFAGRLGRIAGRVTGGLATAVMLFSETGKREVAPGADSRFGFDQLAPGEYELLATAASQAAWCKVWAGEGVNQVTLELAPLPRLKIRAEASDGRAIDPAGILLVPRRQGLSQDLPAAAVAGGQTGTILPGEHSLWAQAPAGQYVEMLGLPPAAVGDRLTIGSGQTLEILVRLSARPAKVHGSVRTADGSAMAPGAPVFLNPIDAELRTRIGGPRSTRAGEDGAYAFAGLPPGRYQVLSSFDFETPFEVDWDTPQAKTVALEQGQDTALDLQLAAGP